jgi:hypothetical protein
MYPKDIRNDAVKFINFTTKRAWKLPTSTQLRATWHTDTLDTVVLPSTGASRCHICCIDGGNSSEYFGYTLINSLHFMQSDSSLPHSNARHLLLPSTRSNASPFHFWKIHFNIIIPRAVTWWNPVAQTRPVLDSSSFAPVLTHPSRTYLHSASSVLAGNIGCRVMALFVFRKPLFIN